jgi:chitodextrinase
VTKSVWHTLETHALINGAAGQVEVWVDGAPVSQLTKTDDLGTDPIAKLQVGDNAAGTSTSPKTYDVAYDDVMADSSFVACNCSNDTTPPSTPTGLSATAVASHEVDLSWTASTDDSGVVAGYKILRDGTQIGTSSGTSYKDLSVVPGTTYTYTVRAYDAAGNTSGDSNSATATPTDTTAPSAPTLSATAPSPTQVNLSWTASTDDTGVTAYDVYRGPSGGSLTLLTTTGGSATSYSDTTATAGTAYDYQVVARDAANNASSSNIASVTTPTTPPPPTTLTLTPDADANVKEASATTNFGNDTTLKADGGAGAQIAIYMKFTVSGVAAGQTVKSAVLRLYVPTDGTVDGPPLFGAADTTWTETGITWSNRPPANTTATTDVGAIAAGTWVEYTVTPLVTGNGTYTLVLGPSTTTDGVVFNSKEATSNKPQLVVTLG